MAFKICFYEEKQLMLTYLCGVLTLKDVLSFASDRRRITAGLKDYLELADCRQKDGVGEMNRSVVHTMATFEQTPLAKERRKGAILAASQETYDLSVYYVECAQLQDKIKVTFSMEDALQWLGFSEEEIPALIDYIDAAGKD